MHVIKNSFSLFLKGKENQVIYWNKATGINSKVWQFGLCKNWLISTCILMLATLGVHLLLSIKIKTHYIHFYVPYPGSILALFLDLVEGFGFYHPTSAFCFYYIQLQLSMPYSNNNDIAVVYSSTICQFKFKFF